MAFVVGSCIILLCWMTWISESLDKNQRTLNKIIDLLNDGNFGKQ